MALLLRYDFSIVELGNGIGPNPPSAQMVQFGNQSAAMLPGQVSPVGAASATYAFNGFQPLPDNPTAAQVTTAAVAAGVDIGLAAGGTGGNAAALARIQGFSTGLP